jgi:hypothetical protein
LQILQGEDAIYKGQTFTHEQRRENSIKENRAFRQRSDKIMPHPADSGNNGEYSAIISQPKLGSIKLVKY